MNNNGKVIADDFKQSLKSISRQVRVNDLVGSLALSMRRSAWMLTIAYGIILLFRLFSIMISRELILALLLLACVYCVLGCLVALLRPISPDRLILLADKHTNRHDMIMNAYKCCVAGRDTVFAQAAMADGLELLRENQGLKLSLTRANPGFICLVPCVAVLLLFMLPVAPSGQTGFRSSEEYVPLVLQTEEVNINQDESRPGDVSGSGNSNSGAGLLSTQVRPYFDPKYNFMVDSKEGSTMRSGGMRSGTMTEEGSNQRAGQSLPGSSDVPKFANVKDVLGKPRIMDGQDSAAPNGNYAISGFDAGDNGELATNAGMLDDRIIIGRSAVGESNVGSMFDSTDKTKNANLDSGIMPFLSGIAREYVRKLASLDVGPYEMGYGGTYKDKKWGLLVSGLKTTKVPIFVKGMSRQGNNRIFIESVRVGGFVLPRADDAQLILPDGYCRSNAALITEKWQSYISLYFELMRDNSQDKEK